MKTKGSKIISKEKALAKAANSCARRELCRFDIRKKLSDWGVEQAVSEEIITILLSENYINEERYTEYYIKDKFGINKWGKIKIKHMLRQKQISEQIIDKKLKKINDVEYKTVCSRLITKKLKVTQETNPYKLKQKIFRYMAGRGFEQRIVTQLYNNTTKNA
ncbi:MAG: regulatory protein RecX [Bacteroidota bacterium]|nr:regulatory protein RecX [Bacteroidota bacterium]